MCIFMNTNVESHVPLAKNLLHLYLYCVGLFSQIRSSVSSYRVSCELKLCPIHIWMEICASFPASIVLGVKNRMGNHLKPVEEIFCAPLMQFRRHTVQVSIGNRKGPNDKQFGKTQYHSGKFRWEKAEKQGLKVMSRTGSCLDIRPVRLNSIIGSSLVKSQNTNQTYSTFQPGLIVYIKVLLYNIYRHKTCNIVHFY